MGGLRHPFNIVHSNGDTGFSLIVAQKAQNGQKWPETRGTPLFVRFFNVYIYNFFPGGGPRAKKWGFNIKLGAQFKKYGFEGSQVPH